MIVWYQFLHCQNLVQFRKLNLGPRLKCLHKSFFARLIGQVKNVYADISNFIDVTRAERSDNSSRVIGQSVVMKFDQNTACYELAQRLCAIDVLFLSLDLS